MTRIVAGLTWTISQTSAKPERWMAVCEELGIATEGDSLDELRNLIPEVMDLAARSG